MKLQRGETQWLVAIRRGNRLSPSVLAHAPVGTKNPHQGESALAKSTGTPPKQ